ncbi:peptidylprolyl isomerase [Parerythrobacter aestuarii]|uniref:peptidylprolyl isomerase n=1 Tax=Parerythrobacter aestuarii TaxID=3020909 RepID=UPI0024DE426E|nr:peptidylprolyl isomerase [Parerythrobacter aestuarii]
MIKHFFAATAALALPFSFPAAAQGEPEGAPSPGQIVDASAQDEWVTIDPEDLLVMTLAPDAEGNARAVVIQLMPAPFSQGWVSNIRTLARAKWYDGISVNRVQDNYVVQWGDPNYDNPEASGEAKALPSSLQKVSVEEYTTDYRTSPTLRERFFDKVQEYLIESSNMLRGKTPYRGDAYSVGTLSVLGWPVAYESGEVWPVHCYGMVGVGRNYSPDTGSGAELYTVIGHAPRHLDRNIALVGRVISGMEHLSSLPRGKGELGFYADFEVEKRTPILSIRVASDLPEAEQPRFEYLSTESESFARYADARANRRDPFFIHPAGGADICNIPVPIRAVAE